ncbi:unnamed protein product (macronuclear) [Paramecium tetraurelia]|uniref:Uncharacterized protein n=1 Tax=Paramecium tetraurelia TaxID=5888 RepID=A0E3B4_PARTE|nr:uncharacterized protein GSPATT00022954001 [Paramecium tetraurelia]CAK89781.1 unnamed protein product [Paramecium tetraurelia]|eukprot:XP_001457178.1 hypothetical protein (macronuclear) [Paramecium tetraurelia strain d4-2]
MDFFFSVLHSCQKWVSLYPQWITVIKKIEKSRQKLIKQKQQKSPKRKLLEVIFLQIKQSTVNPPKKKDPYGSDWAQGILAKQFGVQITQGSQNLSPKWIIKKVQPLDFQLNNAMIDSKVAKDFKSQEKLFRQTATESHRKRLGKVIKQYQQSFNGQISPQHQQSLLNQQYKLPSIP